jgi:osmotically-inducible protein OsmY
MAERWDERDQANWRHERGYRDREYGERDRMDRAGDEVRSWFGDDEAAQRRRMDELRDARSERDRSVRPANTAERTWDRARDNVREMTDRDHDGRRGFAEWNDNDRSRGFLDAPRYATGDSYVAPRWNTTSAGPHTHGNYGGRGPRGYKRGDERIREDVCDRLTEDSRIDASDIDVQVKEGEVTLAGSVRTREEKRFTEDLIERISGVRDVNNNLKVKPADEIIGTARSGSSVLGLTDTPPPPPTKTR